MIHARSVDAPVAPPPAVAGTIRWRTAALRSLLILLAIVAVAFGVRYAMWSFHHESTDDAFVDCHVVQVSPRIAGRVLRVLVTDNQRVQAGDLLVQIDPADFRTALDQTTAQRAEAAGRVAQAQAQLQIAQAAEAQADADIVAARADADLAVSDLARYRATISGAVAKQTLDAASTTAARTAAQLQVKQKARAAAAAQVTMAHAQIEAAAGQLATAEAAVAEAALQLSYTEVRAAEDGRVTEKNVTGGDYVQVGQQLFALVPNDLWVTANFKETQLRDMRPGQPVSIHVDAYAREFRGKVDSVQAGSGSFFSLLPPENATGNYVKVVQRVPVKIVFDEDVSDVLLGPGMSVEPTVTVR